MDAHNYKYDICILGGMGRVGLPLGMSFAHSGKSVILYDINQRAIDIVSQGKMPFLEEGAEDILQEVLNKKLFLSNDRNVLSESRFIVIVIGTPVDDHLNPNFSLFMDFFREITHLLRDDHHVILRSTVFPGTTQKVKRYLEMEGKNTRLSFCPERISQGQAIKELRRLPQIVSSFDEESLREVRDLFSSLTDEIIVLSPKEAELAKLYTNVWRYILFSISNQFYQIALQNDIDYYRIYDAITYKYPRAQGLPKAGFAAGPCLFKDTMQLAAYSNNSFFLGHAAMLINEGLPNIIVQKLKDRFEVKDKVVGILGMAFKGNIDDNRESLSYKLRKLLMIEAKNVLCSDLYIKDKSFVDVDDLVNNSDIIILAAPHMEYASLKISEDKILVDVWNVFGKGGLF